MTNDAKMIVLLCSRLGAQPPVVPLEPRQYSDLAHRLRLRGKRPGDLFSFTAEDFRVYLNYDAPQACRIRQLIDRSAALEALLEQYQSKGIHVVTRADANYPQRLKRQLGNRCPPLFYYAGDLSLTNGPLVGYVGSRNITREDLDFTVDAVSKTVKQGCGVVSGGARGVDTVAGNQALRNGGFTVEYLCTSLEKRLSIPELAGAVEQGRLLMLCAGHPDSGFEVGMAMMRNRLIYAQSMATVVIRSDLNKGGTWAGANDDLKHHWCPLLCRDHPYPGNQALIQKGALPIDWSWNGTIPAVSPAPSEIYDQASLFDQ